ncbi:MAG: YsnF/AvaK domain-containing protein [Thermoproteota archaeon]|nr:YsnF/AvaK domain-containing protein [Thermoproteota archaeon]
MSNTSNSIYWDEVIKKEARGAEDDSDFGEVQDVGQHYVLTQKGLISKDKFYIPKYLVQGYDGSALWFNASESDLEGWKRDSPPDYNEYARYNKLENKEEQEEGAEGKKEVPSDIETRIPLIEERLNVSKRTSTSEATITKKPVTETKTEEVPVTHEELIVETRPASKSTASTTTSERPVQSETEIKIPLNKEEVQVTKEPSVKEEVVIKKEPVTETKKVSESITREEINTSSTRKEPQASGAGNTESNES